MKSITYLGLQISETDTHGHQGPTSTLMCLCRGSYLNDIYTERGEGVLKMQMNADEGGGGDPL